MAAIKILARLALAGGIAAFMVHASKAAVTVDEASQLGKNLTEFGAEKSGNADGSIPAYSGGIEKVAGYDPKTSSQYVDPFRDDRPLYSVTAANMAQYAALLSPGTRELLKTLPGYRLDIYPSHRSMRYTSAVLQNTVKNSTTAKLAGAVTGDTLAGSDTGNLPYAGIPFPIPKNGYEVMWNHNLHFSAAVSEFSGGSLLMDSSGNLTVLAGYNTLWLHPWSTQKVRCAARPLMLCSGFPLPSPHHQNPRAPIC